MRTDQIFSLAILFLLLGFILLAGSQIELTREVTPEPPPSPEPAKEKEPDEPGRITGEQVLYGVEEVVDGDTFIVHGLLDSIRLIGVDTPETNDRRPQLRCLARLATQRLEELIGNEEVILERDVEDRDKYHRFLRYVYLPDGTFVNLVLVKEGYGKILTIPPNVRYTATFLLAQQQARQEQRGLWNPSVCL